MSDRKNFLKNFAFRLAFSTGALWKVSERGKYRTAPRRRKGVNVMDYPNRLEWQTRCEFNAYCKNAIRNEFINACKESKRRQKHEVSFSDLSPHEEKQLYTVDTYDLDGEGEAFCINGKRITTKLLAEALRTLPHEKRQAVLLYYFFDKSDVEIAEELGVPRSTIQYRRTSSFELLKKYLEERADEWD